MKKDLKAYILEYPTTIDLEQIAIERNAVGINSMYIPHYHTKNLPSQT